MRRGQRICPGKTSQNHNHQTKSEKIGKPAVDIGSLVAHVITFVHKITHGAQGSAEAVGDSSDDLALDHISHELRIANKSHLQNDSDAQDDGADHIRCESTPGVFSRAQSVHSGELESKVGASQSPKAQVHPGSPGLPHGGKDDKETEKSNGTAANHERDRTLEWHRHARNRQKVGDMVSD